jgi:hypothetical protein
MTMFAKKNQSATTNTIRPREASDSDKSKALYPSSMYQKVLDYHVAEILLSTIVLAVIALLRLHR